MHPDFLLEQLTSSQLAEWEAFYKIEPWGCRVEDYRFGVVASTLLSPSIKKGRKVPKWNEIFPEYVKTPKKQSVEEMKSILMSMVKK